MPNRDEPELDAYWTDVHPTGKRRRRVVEAVQIPPVEPFLEWTLGFHHMDRSSMRVVPGASPQDRVLFFQRYMDPQWERFRPGAIENVVDTQGWLDPIIGVLGDFTRRVENLQVPLDGWPKDREPGPWQLLVGLLDVEEFVVEEPLRAMVDQDFYLVHTIYRALWEARFMIREETVPLTRVKEFTDALERFITRAAFSQADYQALLPVVPRRLVDSDHEAMDMLLFLLTLAAQNGVINRALFAFDGLEKILKPECRSELRQLDSFLGDVDRWVSKRGCPVGIAIGFDATRANLNLLKRLNPKLYTRIDAGLGWTR